MTSRLMINHSCQFSPYRVQFANTASSMFIASQPSCPPLLASRFAENQTAWRQQGRFITYCSRGGGFGSWLRGLGSAFAISILAERALILDGTCKQLPTAVAKHVA